MTAPEQLRAPAHPPAAGRSSDRRTRARPPRLATWALVVAALAVCLPLLVAVVQMRSPTWRPVLDLAMTELRVRDVGGSDTPLVGLPGRIGETLEEQGSHPGPLSFYALAPTYRLLGSSAWALQLGTVAVHLGAVLVALVLARRRGGTPLVGAVAAGLAVLVAGYGSGALTEPWNPYLPLLWWVVLLLAVWSVLCGDLPVLAVAVVAGSFCAQTHVPYLTLAVGLGGLAAIAVLLAARRAPPRSRDRAAALRWGAVALGLGVLLWLPPTVDQIVEERGNYAKLVDHFTSPPDDEEPIGVRSGVSEALQRLDLWHLLPHQLTEPGLLTQGSAERFPSAWRGALLLLGWAAAAAASWRVGDHRLRALHGLAGVALLLGVASISRIFGLTWFYLMLWMWAIAALMAAATAMTAWHWWSRREPAGQRADRGALLARLGVVLAVAAVLVSVRSAVDAASAEQSDIALSRVLDQLVTPTVDALERGEGAATGRGGTYLVTWNDALHIGSQAYGLLSELERAGFDAGLLPVFAVPATQHRTVEPGEATAVVELATGHFVDRRRAEGDAVEVAHVDPRSPADADRFGRLRDRVVGELRDEGLDDVVAAVDGNLFGAAVDPRVPDVTRRLMDEMLQIGLPTSVFVLSPGSP